MEELQQRRQRAEAGGLEEVVNGEGRDAGERNDGEDLGRRVRRWGLMGCAGMPEGGRWGAKMSLWIG